MTNFEKVEKLVQKANVSYEEAKAALDKADGDLLDAVILLEKEGKTQAPRQSSFSTEYEQQTQYVSVAGKVEDDRRSYDKEEQRRERRERAKKGFGNIVDFLTRNFLFIKRNGDVVVKLPLWAVILIFLAAWHISIIAVIVSLFFGVTYSFRGEADMNAANTVMDKASSAAEKVKEEYNKLEGQAPRGSRPERKAALNGSILIVEDEEKLARFIELELTHEGYAVRKAADGRAALGAALSEDFDLILLDIMLPEINGLEVLRRLQNEKPTPVILLTARDSVMDKVAGLDAGAVDYITKPFAIEELLARIRVALKNKVRRSAQDGGPPEAEEGVLAWGLLRLDSKRRDVSYDGHRIDLTNREFLMLKTLLENKDIVLSRDTLLERVCGYDYIGETNIVDVYIRHLRSKIDETFGVKMLQTVRGAGYVIRSE